LYSEYNLYARSGYDAALEPLCREAGLGVAPFYSLASGFLTGKYRSEADFGKSPRGGRMSSYLNERGHSILSALDEAADEHHATSAQIALAWLMARPGLTAPIASATSLEQLAELMGAARVELDEDTIMLLDAASA